MNLHDEIYLTLFDTLEKLEFPNTTACLGLTCKKFYPIFKAYLPKNVSLLNEYPSAIETGEEPLYALLKDWVPSGLFYAHFKNKFCHKFTRTANYADMYGEYARFSGLYSSSRTGRL